MGHRAARPDGDPLHVTVAALSTPSQTIGPFFHLALGLPATRGPCDEPGTTLLHGQLLDGAGDGVADGLVELWDGRELARCATGSDGRFELWVRADAIAASTPPEEAPCLAVSVFARGLLCRLVTRCYLPGHEARFAADASLASVPADRRATLLAVVVEDGLRFDIVLQGDRETVFYEH